MKKRGRKRSIASILDEYNTPSSSTSNQLSTEITTRKTRAKVQCFCSKCNGKLVDPRTKVVHEAKRQRTSLEQLHSEQSIPLSTNKIQVSQMLIDLLDSTMLSNTHSLKTSDLSDNVITIRTRSRNLPFLHIK
jgi:hypothetical protein